MDLIIFAEKLQKTLKLMNIYLRYFDNETLVSDVEQALDFLQSIPDIDVDDSMATDLRHFVESNVMYPKRYKVKTRAYFIVIKTTASSLEELRKLALSGMKQTTSLQQKNAPEQSLLHSNNWVGMKRPSTLSVC